MGSPFFLVHGVVFAGDTPWTMKDNGEDNGRGHGVWRAGQAGR